MAIIEISVWECTCDVCGEEWTSEASEPTVCCFCGSPDWNYLEITSLNNSNEVSPVLVMLKA